MVTEDSGHALGKTFCNIKAVAAGGVPVAQDESVI
jgi:hypothetical protein